MSKQVLYDIQGMIRECKDKKNPNRVREHYKKELTTIFNIIDKELHLRYAQVDGLEVGNKEDYEQQCVVKQVKYVLT